MTKAFAQALTESSLIEKIVYRAIPMAKRANVEADRDSLFELISTAHSLEPLDLEALYTAQDQLFAHDVFGLRNFIEPRTGLYLTDWRPFCLKVTLQ